jgi:quinol-cytochrome oxidoreductase complex cytochrome b subunit
MKPAAPKHSGLQAATIAWLDRRLPFVDAIDTELYRRIPNYATAFHRYLGALTVILVCIELVTGILLTVYYVPDATGDPAQAFTSVRAIQETVRLGWLVRGMHYWGASALLIVAVLHMTAVFWTGGYRAPREINWTVGVVLLLVVVGFVLTGSLLPWNVNAYLARATELEIASGNGIFPAAVSEQIKFLLQAGPLIGPATLLRFYVAHVILLPVVALGLIYIHLRLVRRLGPAEPR